MEKNIQTFEDLQCWRACRDLRRFIANTVVPGLPRYEKGRIGDQMLRAARSTTANIAEGYGRFHYMDNAKFCSNARGSCWEVLDHLITARDENLIALDEFENGKQLVHQAIKILNGYMKYLYAQSKKGKSVRDEIGGYGEHEAPGFLPG